jgi:hypothetical protein
MLYGKSVLGFLHFESNPFAKWIGLLIFQVQFKITITIKIWLKYASFQAQNQTFHVQYLFSTYPWFYNQKQDNQLDPVY